VGLSNGRQKGAGLHTRLFSRAYVAKIDWETTTLDDDPGLYKIQYFGDAFDAQGIIHPVTDASREFRLT
jgi:hypothetical protein